MKTIHFNTGRMYTRHGQRITATLHDDGVVTFYDHDRMIDGEYRLLDDVFGPSNVRRMYDGGSALGSSRSHLDAFQIGGCNSKYEGK